MAKSKTGSEPPDDVPKDDRDSGDESSGDESEVLEESPCGRWQKRREEVRQRDVPGIDSAFLAMDTEEGVEVVWNEVQISEKKSSRTQLDKMKQVFDNLIQLEHANIVKFHKYWTDTKMERPRIVFITEFMSSGSLKQFLKKTKKNNKTLKAWKRWCTQILSALSYLHSCEPPIIHGNLTCDTIFIQHNGLIKIGSVAPDAIYKNVKTYKEQQRNLHYIAPEFGAAGPVTTTVDIYSFGICALEMAALEIPGNGETGHVVTDENIQKALNTLEDPLQRDFIERCVQKDPNHRPTARDLLFHSVLFEVHSLKLLSAHTCVKNASILPDHMIEEAYQSKIDPQQVIASIIREDDRESVHWKASQTNTLEIEKFVEDVKNGVYPLTAFSVMHHVTTTRPRAISPDVAESVKCETPEPAYSETRYVTSMNCNIRDLKDEEHSLQMTLQLRMNDKMNRQLEAKISIQDTAHGLATELVQYGFISGNDRQKIAVLISETLQNRSHNGSPPLVTQNT